MRHTDRLPARFKLPRMELHLIADDLDEHTWYVELVADFVEDVERFVYALDEVAEPDQPAY